MYFMKCKKFEVMTYVLQVDLTPGRVQLENGAPKVENKQKLSVLFLESLRFFIILDNFLLQVTSWKVKHLVPSRKISTGGELHNMIYYISFDYTQS